MLNWDEIEIVIPCVLSVPGRPELLNNLLIQIAQQCPEVMVRLLPQHDRPNDLAKHAFNILSKGFKNFSRPWVILIEDDVVLSQEFGARVPEVLEDLSSKAGAISFFTPDKHSVRMLYKKQQRYYEVPNGFAYSQCVAFKREVIEGWADRMLGWYEKRERYATPDLSISDCLNDMGVKLFITLPSLVQHVVTKSAFNHNNTSKKQSPTFEINEQ